MRRKHRRILCVGRFHTWIPKTEERGRIANHPLGKTGVRPAWLGFNSLPLPLPQLRELETATCDTAQSQKTTLILPDAPRGPCVSASMDGGGLQ